MQWVCILLFFFSAIQGRIIPDVTPIQSSQIANPSSTFDPTNCGSVADLKPLRDNKCYKKYSADPSGTCAKYVGSGHNYMMEGPFVGTYCACKTMFAQSGFNCTGGCNPEERQALQCPGISPCYLDDQNQNRPACRCINGYKLEQGKCIRQFNYCDTCEFNCHFSQKCQDTGNRESGTGYTCGPCSEEMGFEPLMGGGLTGWCQNINECSDGKHKCEPKATCIDKDPTYANGTKYLCQCKAGWEGVGTTCSPCTDVNECLIPNICGKNSDCTNTPGSYSCKCRTGYKPGGSTYSEQGHQDCVDIDECAESPQPCKAFSACNNTAGSYECPCNPGYVGDGKIRGCKLADSICTTCDKKTTKCGVNSAETAYECQCVANHISIAGNTTHCKPVTYCDKGASTLRCAPPPKSTCTDNPDGSGFTCRCNPGYVDEGTGDSAGKGYVCSLTTETTTASTSTASSAATTTDEDECISTDDPSTTEVPTVPTVITTPEVVTETTTASTSTASSAATTTDEDECISTDDPSTTEAPTVPTVTTTPKAVTVPTESTADFDECDATDATDEPTTIEAAPVTNATVVTEPTSTTSTTEPDEDCEA